MSESAVTGALVDSVVIRRARKAHHCSGPHDGTRRRTCGSGPILPGSLYIEYQGESCAYSSGLRYHWACAITQGLIAYRDLAR